MCTRVCTGWFSRSTSKTAELSEQFHFLLHPSHLKPLRNHQDYWLTNSHRCSPAVASFVNCANTSGKNSSSFCGAHKKNTNYTVRLESENMIFLGSHTAQSQIFYTAIIFITRKANARVHFQQDHFQSFSTPSVQAKQIQDTRATGEAGHRGWSPKLIPKFVSTECDISFPSLPCHPYALQFCPPHGLPVGFATTTHSSKGQKRTVLTCFRLPCCTLHFFQGSNWYTSDVKSANQEKTLTLLYLHHSYYTVNIPWGSVSFFWICSIAKHLFSPPLQGGRVQIGCSHILLNLTRSKTSSPTCRHSALPRWETFVTIICFSDSHPLLLWDI